MRDVFASAGARLANDLHRASDIDPGSRPFMDDLLLRHSRFREAVMNAFAAADNGDRARAVELDEHTADPASHALQQRFNARSRSAPAR